MIFLLLAPLLDREPAVGGADEVHAEVPGEVNETYAIMLCGASCTFDADGDTNPKGFDFYAYEHRHKATCAACRRAS